MKVHIAYGNPDSGNWEPVEAIEFPECDNSWIAEGRLPSEAEMMLPKRPFVLPTGELIELGVFRVPADDVTNFFLYCAGKNFLQLLSKGAPQLMFTSPGGSVVSLAIYGDGA